MPLGEALDDDYVVSLLKKDAEANKKRYLSSGLGPLLSKRTNAPKPNTRFLKNIVRDADAHNAALKAKEEEQSEARLKEFKKDHRLAKRARDENDGEESSPKRRRGADNPGRWASALGGLGKSAGGLRREKGHDKVGRTGKGEEGRSRKHEREQSRSRSRSRERIEDERRSKGTAGVRPSKGSADPERSTAGRRQKLRSPSPTPPRSRSPQRRRNSNRRPNASSQAEDDTDSDPLADLIGPKLPPPAGSLPRGRGAYRPYGSSTTIDARFDPAYNPRADIDASPPEYDDEGKRDDWDMALEALRDRAKWRARGGERLRAAGFSEGEVEKWEKASQGGASLLAGSGNGGAEKDIEDVRWAKKGEGREWDRGKVVEGDSVDLRPNWVQGS